MLVPIFKTILPKTLLKWTTPQSKLATKFKTKSTTTTIGRTSAAKTTLTLLFTTASFKTATTTQHIKTASSSSLSLSSSSSSFSSSKAFYISILIVAKLFLHTVINNLSSLMNDFRTKLRYLTTATTTSNSTLFSNLASSSSSTKTTTIDTKLFNNNYKNNHRTYNNSSKSNKVFLYYTPRDPRLRIFNQPQQQQQKPLSLATLNKHLVSLESDSELKITEDLCNYGELIGGFSLNINKTNNISGEWCNCITQNLNNNNKKTIVNCCDFQQINFDESVNINNTLVKSEKSVKSDKTDKDSQNNCKELLQEQHQQQQQEEVFKVQQLNKSSVYGHRMNHNCSNAIKGIFNAVIRF